MGLTDDVAVHTETPAEVFDRLFLPALAAPWAIRVAEAAHVAPGQRVLDVACGTGAVAAEALRRVGPKGKVIGLDLSSDMLAVARRKMPDLEFFEGRAESLPFEDETFDAVACQFGLMFFAEREQAIREMQRVLRPKGRIAIAVWDSLERTPGYAALTDLVERHLGAEAGNAVRAAFVLGDVELMRSLLATAGFVSVEAASVDATARFPSLEDWVEAEVRGWVGGDFGEADYATLLDDARRQLSAYKRDDGAVEFALPAIIASGLKSG